MRIKIVNPCSENFNQMDSVGKHKFCRKCSKTVYDLSELPDEKLYRFLIENPSVCGRINKNQIHRELSAGKNKRSTKLIPWLSALVLLFGQDKIYGQRPVKEKIMIKEPVCPKIPVGQVKTDTTTAFCKDKNIIITGKTLDESGNPLPFTIIMAKNSKIACFSDIYGSYRLIIPPDSIKGDSITISYTFITHNPHVLTISFDTIRQNIIQHDVVLKEQPSLFVGLIEVEENPVKLFFRKLWHWLRK